MKLSHVAGTVLAFGLSAGSAFAENVTIRFSNWLPPTHYIITEMIKPWMDQVEEATDGRVTFQMQPALGAPAAHLDLVSTGVADLGFVPHSYTPARFKLTEMGELPFTSDDAVANSVAYWRTYQKFMLGANEHKGVKLLSFWTTTPQQLFMTNEVSNLTDLEGEKVRITSPILEAATDALGTTPITASTSDIYEMMSRGTVDGTFFQPDSIVAFRLSDYVKTQINVPGGFAHSSQMLIMNQAKWDAISPEDQAKIEALSGETISRNFAEVWDAKAQEGSATLAEQGMTVKTIEGEDLLTLKDKLSYLREDWVKAAAERGVDGDAALAYYAEQLAKLTAE
ncbi:TRAP transporter substrate-binding protein [Celeribacter sp. ULVN23_4]